MDRRAGETMGWTPPSLGRRAFLIGGAGAALVLPMAGAARAAVPGIPSSGKIEFKVMRKGWHIGEHILHFTQDGDNLTVETDVRIVVRIGPVPVYHHNQTCIERWRGDRFVSLDSTTQSTAAHDKASAHRMPDGVYIQPAEGAPYTAPAEALPQTHWNHLALQGPLFNPENGKLLHETLVGRTDDMVKLADGSSIRATRYSMTGDGVEEDYYDSAGVWAGLRAKVEDGSYVEYLRL
jgi:hypothetical protein